MKFLVLFGCLGMNMLCYAQTVIRQVRDEQTGAPVSFATIKVLNKPGGVVTGANGQFSLNLIIGDSILVTSDGYQNKIILGMVRDSVIYMKPKPSRENISHEPVHKGKEILLGIEENEKSGDIKWGPAPRMEFAQEILLPDTGKLFRIKNVLIPVSSQNCFGNILLKIYRVDPLTGLPGDAVLVKEVALKGNMVKKKVAQIPVEAYNIFFSQSKAFYIGVSWPQDAHSSRCVTFLRISEAGGGIRTVSRSITRNDFNWSRHCFERKDAECGGGTAFGVEAEMWD